MYEEPGRYEEQLVRSWRSNSAAWSNTVRNARIESRRLVTDGSIVDAIRASGARTVLDVGCGEGWLARRLIGGGIEVTGIDGSPELIEIARKSGEGHFLIVAYDELVEPSSLVSGPYECIVCNFSLLGEAIREVLHALRDRITPDGTFMLQTVHPFTSCGDAPYVDGWRIETFEGLGDGFSEPMPWYFRTFGSWISELAAAGWRVENCLEPLHPHSQVPASLIFVCRTTFGPSQKDPRKER